MFQEFFQDLQFSAVQVVGTAAVVWVMVVGIAYMARGPQGALAVFLWPLRMSFRLTRWAVGGLVVAVGNLIVAIGNWIRG